MTRGLIAAYREIDALVDAIEALKKQKFSTFTVYTPTPRHEIEHALHPPTSKIRLFTLIGGLCGVTFGYWIAIWTSDYWPLVVGGKAVASWIPYTIIGFEVMVLVARSARSTACSSSRASRRSPRRWASIHALRADRSASTS